MNFDEERNERASRRRQFTIGGETFSYRAGVEPEVLADWMDVGADTPELEAVRIADKTIVAFLDPSQADLWHQIRQPGALENPITSGDLLALIRWLISEQAGRPTEPSGSSSNGSQTQRSEGNLTDESSSTAEQASTT